MILLKRQYYITNAPDPVKVLATADAVIALSHSHSETVRVDWGSVPSTLVSWKGFSISSTLSDLSRTTTSYTNLFSADKFRRDVKQQKEKECKLWYRFKNHGYDISINEISSYSFFTTSNSNLTNTYLIGEFDHPMIDDCAILSCILDYQLPFEC